MADENVAVQLNDGGRIRLSGKDIKNEKDDAVVLNNVLSGSERSSIGVRPHKGVTRRKIVCYFFITILRIHAFQKKIWNPF